MSPLISIQNLSKAFGTQTLFKQISFNVFTGDRIGLLGPNGSGKSTLLKVIVGIEPADEGQIARRQGVRVGYASQEPEFAAMPIEQVLMQEKHTGDDLEFLTRAQILLGKAQFSDFHADASLLSGGWKKRLDIVRALMHEPDLILMDEPTNHLDLEGIEWLEKFLLREKTSYLIVSHDRYFLENVCTKIIELNKCYPQGLFISDGNLSTYMERKEAFLEAQAQQQRGLASVVRNEIDWLRTSPKARTTKSRSRIQRAYSQIAELEELQRRNTKTSVSIDFTASERQTRKLLVAKNIAKSFGDKQLIKNLDLTLSPGTRLGIVGKNGTGKSTLLKMLANMVPQDTGTVKYADELKLVYFDQHRERIPGHLSIREALSPHGEMVNYRGQSIHVNGWAKRFLFSSDRLGLPLNCLSGGERARILIAKLMLEPADILFLDEPTNDLDIQTLEVIEDSLQDFAGAVVLISHDRCLMERLCTQILALSPGGSHHFYADFAQWEAAENEVVAKKEPASTVVTASSSPSRPKKLSYKEQKELEGMENAILEAEEKLSVLHKQLEDPVLHADQQKSLDLYNQIANADLHLKNLFDRWHYLEEQK